MPESSRTFRDFGISIESLRPPRETIQCFLSRRAVAAQYVSTGVVTALGIGLTCAVAMTMAPPLSLLACAAMLAGLVVLVYLATHNDHWRIELKEDTLRAEHLYTGLAIHRSIDEIDSLDTLFGPVRRLETVVAEKLTGRVRGVTIRFRDHRTPLQIVRAGPVMVNAQELLEGVAYRMMQVRELDAEIIELAGRPLVRSIYWKGERPTVPSQKNVNVILVCVMGLALLFGVTLGYWGLQEQGRRAMAAVPPHETTLSSLIEHGPGSNRHITITDFRPSGYAFESNHGSRTCVWVALFPVELPPGTCTEIKVVLESRSVRDEAALTLLLQRGRVTGICSTGPTTRWGASVGSNLRRANPGCKLSSAWSVEEMNEPPSEAFVTELLAGSTCLLAVVLILAVVIFWRNV
jgi:hypothetical protein